MTVPFVALGPGPTFDTLGDADGKPVVAIEGTPVKPTSGHLNMTTVSQRDGLSLGQALVLWGSGSEQLLPRDLVFPAEKSREDIEKSQSAEFQRSEDNAESVKLAQQQSAKLEDAFSQLAASQTKTLQILIKADVQGSAEALKDAMGKLAHEEVNVKVIGSSVGGVSASDVTLAAASKAIIIAFNVRADGAGRDA